MTNNIAKIRAALEMARDYITSDLASERGAFEGYEGVSRIDEIKADLANNVAALAALAELERATAQQFVAGEVGKRMLKNAYHRALNRIIEISERSGSNATIAEQAREWLDAWRSELGPALGMVEIREPSDDGCRDIWREAKANDGDGSKVCAGRAMFDACRAVMWPKEGI